MKRTVYYETKDGTRFDDHAKAADYEYYQKIEPEFQRRRADICKAVTYLQLRRILSEINDTADTG